MHYSGSNSCLLINGFKVNKFKAKDSEISAVPLCLGKVSKDSSTDILKNTGFYEYVFDFWDDHDSIDSDDILCIHKYLIKKTQYKTMFRLILKRCLLDY